MQAVLVLLGLFLGNIIIAHSAPQSWAGTILYAPYAWFESLNVTVFDNNTANFDWVWTVDASGRKCVLDNTHDLVWKQQGNTFTAANPNDYYKFNGTISDNKKSISGRICEYTSGKCVGTFNVQLNARQVPSKCNDPQPNLWPLPQSYTMGSTAMVVVPSQNFFKTSATSDILAQAFKRYTEIIFPHISHKFHINPPPQNTLAAPQISSVSVTIDADNDDYPQLGTDESYELVVDSTSTVIHASTVYGALRGLETFSQLVVYDYDTTTYTVSNAPWMIKDSPRFPHRGLMIDCARHYQPVSSILHIIDSLPFAKLNVLHIHIADEQSFPLQSFSSPKLWLGSFSSQERYTQDDISEIVEYAHYRGVRVMVEFDMPAHANAMCAGYPEICPTPTCRTPLNVANEKTFQTIEALLMEMTGGRPSEPGNPSPGLFKDNFIHLGGDEVDTACWTTTPSIQKWLQMMNFTADQAYGYFVDRVAKIALSQGHRPVQWSEVFDHFKEKLSKGTVVHIWKPNTNVTEVVALGYNVLLNVGYFPLSWYLDNLDIPWDAVYRNEPCDGVPDKLCPLILGGHGEMWGESVDASDLQQTVWPKLASISEILWSSRAASTLSQAHPRIQYFRCLLNSRGILAAPVNNPYARTSPPDPGSCYDQRKK